MTRTRKIALIILLALLVIVVAISARYLVNRFSPRTPAVVQTTTEAPSGETPAETESAYDLVADFTVINDAGEQVSLHDFIGKPIIVNFWATWCDPCKFELPAFEKAYRDYGDKVEFLMVNLTDGFLETLDGAKDFMAVSGYDFPVYYDTLNSVDMSYDTSTIPVTLMIDENGELVRSMTGAINEFILVNSIERMLD